MDITLLPNFDKDTDKCVTAQVVDKLITYGATVHADKSWADSVDFRKYGDKFNFTERGELFKNKDAAIIIGGDGSILREIKHTAVNRISILGVNLGRVGYIAEIERHELELLEKLTSGEYTTEERFMLQTHLYRENSEVITQGPILNDAVISNGPVPRIIHFNISRDGTDTTPYHSNGVIAATPTGSTSYSMSAGGVLLETDMRAICLTPICPYLIVNRPIVLSGDTCIEISGIDSRENDTCLTTDGCDDIRLMPGDRVEITASEYTTSLIKLKQRGFLSVLHTKIIET